MERGNALTDAWFRVYGLQRPVLVRSARGSGLTAPPSLAFEASTVAELIGKDKLAPVFECSSQGLCPGWTLGQWAAQWGKKRREVDPAFVVSELEVNGTDLDKVLAPPYAIERVCAFQGKMPKFCDMGQRGSWIDFTIQRIASQWIYAGNCPVTILTVPPTPRNIAAFDAWSPNPTRFFPLDAPGPLLSTTIPAEGMLLLPSGWPYAVVFESAGILIRGEFYPAEDVGRTLALRSRLVGADEEEDEEHVLWKIANGMREKMVAEGAEGSVQEWHARKADPHALPLVRMGLSAYAVAMIPHLLKRLERTSVACASRALGSVVGGGEDEEDEVEELVKRRMDVIRSDLEKLRGRVLSGSKPSKMTGRPGFLEIESLLVEAMRWAGFGANEEGNLVPSTTGAPAVVLRLSRPAASAASGGGRGGDAGGDKAVDVDQFADLFDRESSDEEEEVVSKYALEAADEQQDESGGTMAWGKRFPRAPNFVPLWAGRFATDNRHSRRDIPGLEEFWAKVLPDTVGHERARVIQSATVRIADVFGDDDDDDDEGSLGVGKKKNEGGGRRKKKSTTSADDVEDEGWDPSQDGVEEEDDDDDVLVVGVGGDEALYDEAQTLAKMHGHSATAPPKAKRPRRQRKPSSKIADSIPAPRVELRLSLGKKSTSTDPPKPSPSAAAPPPIPTSSFSGASALAAPYLTSPVTSPQPSPLALSSLHRETAVPKKKKSMSFLQRIRKGRR